MSIRVGPRLIMQTSAAVNRTVIDIGVSCRRRAAIAAALSVSLWTTPVPAGAQSSASTGSQPSTQPPSPWTFSARDTFRVENWHFFEPQPGGGDPDYTFVGNRLLLQATFAKPRFELTVGAQYVGLLNLPEDASGPGALGTGALYFAQSGRHENVQSLYLKYARLRLRDLLPGLDLEVGRQAYTSGAEARTSEAALETLKRQRIDARLVGEFEWSMFQRSFDGIRADWRGGDVQLTGSFLMPTQGGFAREAGTTMTDIRVTGGAATLLPSTDRPVELQGFVWRYDDEREVTDRPDNTGLTAARADVHVSTFGGTALFARPVTDGRVDLLGWLAFQRGDWYGQDHSASAFATEGGYRWTAASWSPWVRAGWFYASGDDDPEDASHGTFFPMLPTMRRFSQTTAYSTMNLKEAFVQLQLAPAASTSVRVDLRRLWLASFADRWYAGSGATLESASVFGYPSRPSNGSTDFGTAVELSASQTAVGPWSINGFAGTIDGGPVVTGTFRGDRLWFLYIESGLRLDWPRR